VKELGEKQHGKQRHHPEVELLPEHGERNADLWDGVTQRLIHALHLGSLEVAQEDALEEHGGHDDLREERTNNTRLRWAD